MNKNNQYVVFWDRFHAVIVYLYDASIYPSTYRYSDAYYEDNSTQNGLYLQMTINEKDKLEFNTTVMDLWKNKRKITHH